MSAKVGDILKLPDLLDENYKRPKLGAAHVNPEDAYKDVPILKRPPWRNDVAAYFFLGGVSAGAAMIGSLIDAFNWPDRQQLARTAHYISFATLLPCPPLLIDDLGVPMRFHHMLRIFKPSSPMNLGAWALFIHGAGATLTVVRMLEEEEWSQRIPPLNLASQIVNILPERVLAALGIPSSFALAGYTGVLIGTTSVPVWHTSPLTGALFMSSAFSTGAAATALVSALTERHDEKDQHALATLGAAMGTAEVALLAGYVVTTGEASKPLFQGTAKKLLVGAAIALVAGVLLEATSLTTGTNKKLVSGVAATCTLAGGAMLRWGVIWAGRHSAADREGTIRAMKPRKGSPGWGPGR